MSEEILSDGAAPVPAAWVEVARHPNAQAAMRRFAANMLRLCDEDQHLSAVFRDAGRYVAAMSAAYLHNAGGLTVPLLKQICAGSGFLSPGRARAIIEFLRHVGYLQPEDETARSPRYLPTERFLLAWRGHFQAALDAAALLDPSLAHLANRLDHPSDFAVFLATQAARLHALTRDIDPFPRLRPAFLDPYAGSQILWLLIVANEGKPETLRLSLSDTAARFDVTHLHVRRLLKQAEREGMITYHGHGRLSFTPLGTRTVELFYAFQLSELIEIGKAMQPAKMG